MKKKWNRKRNYKKYIKIEDKKQKFFRKHPRVHLKKIIKIIIFFIILSLTFLATAKIFFIKKKKILYKKEEMVSIIEQLNKLTNNQKNLTERIERCLVNDPDEEKCFYQFLCPKEVIGKKKVLYGPKSDGSYVLLDDLENIKIAYSIGIDSSIEFDKALAKRGIDVYMYDHTIDKLPYENPKFHWKKIGIGGNSQRSSNIQTLQEMIKDNGHNDEKNMIFKIDCEGPEWNALKDTSEDILLQFKYLTLEFHFDEIYNASFYDVLKKLHKTHQPFFVHCNPSSTLKISRNNIMCSALEISYIIREGNKFATDKYFYPNEEFYRDHKSCFNLNILKLFDLYKKT